MDLRQGVYGRQRVYDRNPLVGALRYEAEEVAPHIKTLRDTFVIPLDKRCKIGVIDATMIRTSTSSDTEKALIEINAEPAEGGELPFQLALLYDRLISARVDNLFSLEIFANPGTTLNLFTTDLSASGEILYISYVVYQLFDL